MNERINIVLIEPPGQRGYVPIASAYLVAYAYKDALIKDSFSFSLNLRHFHEPFDRVLGEILKDGAPAIAAFSCQGWSVRRADLLAQRLRALNPGLTIIYGGNHVSYQGEAFFARRPYADILVNGEGEETFHEILLAYLHRGKAADLSHIPGLSYRTPDGAVQTTEARRRKTDLAAIPSPYLSGVLDITPESCGTALLETNRGCPYSCSYCYWGGAIGQKIHTFPLERLRAEMLWLARRRIDSWYICDANFGILPQDAELVEYAVELYREYGYPKTFNTNWAKNSNERIVTMCARLNDAGIHSAYSLSLQTTTPRALQLANRANMKINRIEEITALCREHGIVPRGELIWGLPGESYEQFLNSYEDAAEHTDALQVYPHLLLPNTGYLARREELGISMEQGELDTDYYYCSGHREMTRDDFLQGLRFIISNNIVKVGSCFFRLYPRVAKRVAGLSYARTVEALGEWIPVSTHPMAARFSTLYRFPLATHRLSLGETWQAIRDDRDGLIDMFRCYVEEMFHATLPPPQAAILRSAFAFEALTYPVMDSQVEEEATPGNVYVKEASFDYDFLALKRGGAWDAAPRPCLYTLALPKGLWRYPFENWYIGLVSYQARVERAEATIMA